MLQESYACKYCHWKVIGNALVEPGKSWNLVFFGVGKSYKKQWCICVNCCECGHQQMSNYTVNRCPLTVWGWLPVIPCCRRPHRREDTDCSTCKVKLKLCVCCVNSSCVATYSSAWRVSSSACSCVFSSTSCSDAFVDTRTIGELSTAWRRGQWSIVSQLFSHRRAYQSRV